MLNVIKRELSIQFSSLKGFQGLSILLSLFFIGFVVNDKNFINYIILMFVIGAIGYTELENRNKVYLSILSGGCTRKDYVVGKYLFIIIWTAIISIFALILSKLLFLAASDTFGDVNIYQLKTIILYAIVMVSVYYFLYFSLGMKAAKISYYIVFILYMFGFICINSSFEYGIGREFSTKIINVIFSTDILVNVMTIIFTLAISAILCVLSVILYEKKDL